MRPMGEIASVRATARRPAVKESPAHRQPDRQHFTLDCARAAPASAWRLAPLRPRYSEELRVPRRSILDGVRASEARERQPE
jgi:hypothetical protein